jgi:hypothetical protein
MVLVVMLTSVSELACRDRHLRSRRRRVAAQGI